jgi:hypothetical protein
MQFISQSLSAMLVSLLYDQSEWCELEVMKVLGVQHAETEVVPAVVHRVLDRLVSEDSHQLVEVCHPACQQLSRLHSFDRCYLIVVLEWG